jgi:AraC-like DNA-binding protein
MGRPRKNIDPAQVEELASIDCSYAEMAAVLGCNESTLTRRFAQAIERGRNRGKTSLKRKQFELAMAGDRTMLVWLGKVRLGQRETQVIETRELPQIVIE